MQLRNALTLLLAATTLAPAATQNTFYRPKSALPKKGTLQPKQTPGLPVVVNAASYLPGISPGGLATIYGQNLTTVTTPQIANQNPLPLHLGDDTGDVSVDVNGIPAPLFYVGFGDGQDQINFQVPYEAPTGPGAARITVYNFGNPVITISTDSFTEDPGIFMYDGNYAIAALASNFELIGPSNPAFPGDILTLYVTGLGPLTLNLQDGYGAPSDPLAYTMDPFQVSVNGEQCQVLFSGLGPGFVGLYQINFVLPSDVPAGNLDIQIFSSYANSQVATLPVQ